MSFTSVILYKIVNLVKISIYLHIEEKEWNIIVPHLVLSVRIMLYISFAEAFKEKLFFCRPLYS